MRIKSLVIQETIPQINVIRRIDFVLDGANFIVDNTSAELRDSGNSIGKSTVAKIIDLCLGGKTVSTLYSDSETKNKDINIEEYLNKNKLEAILEVLAPDNSIVQLCCSLFPKGYRKINEKKYSYNDYLTHLNKIFFNLTEDTPTFKQLISKFVRINTTVDERIFKFLSFAPNSVYESVYSFLFKLAEDDIVAQKAELENELLTYKHITESYKRTKQLQSIELLEQKLLAINTELKEIRDRRSKIKYEEVYQTELKKNQELVTKSTQLSSSIDSCLTEIYLIEEAINEQQAQVQVDDTSTLQFLYKEASNLLNTVSKQFGELVKFHNSMIQNKIKFLEGRKSQLQDVLEELKKNYKKILEEKKKIAINILDAGMLATLNTLNAKVEELSKEQGEIEKSLKIWRENEENIDRVTNLLEELKGKTDLAIIDDNIATFNEFFTKYSARLYADSCVIAYNKANDGTFPIRLGNIGGVGSGKKKGLISAFDLAYYAFAVKKGITCPKFIIHDKMETTDKKQLQEIFNITEENKAQLIIPILNEKLSFLDAEQRKKHIVLELSNSDKFFKIK